jgi:hypothetical protein
VSLVVVLLRATCHFMLGVLQVADARLFKLGVLASAFSSRGALVLVQLLGFVRANTLIIASRFAHRVVQRCSLDATFTFRHPTFAGSIAAFRVVQQRGASFSNSSTTRRCTRPPTASLVPRSASGGG